MVNILICVTGSVAAVKLPLLVTKLKQIHQEGHDSIQIRIVLTEASLHFFSLKEVEDLLPKNSIFRDVDEWSTWKKMGDPVLHIELRNWAQIGVIAPLDANTLGKLANGICDNLVTCVLRAWDVSKPILMAPAMNVHMWNHPLTDRCLKILHQFGYTQIGPIAKRLACNDIGMGAMAEIDQIVEKIIQIYDAIH
ncbi:hypothetical protein SSS_07198 [Sarcoptes scabiei]|uniref:Phosphopantothenoylcysteine decarboxylase n=1 Tax=Sarcoptes scabiei TaxID=52283 RepID=A0A132AEV6_SARSC|nr:hypothetical protein SSS_07198 [Sarcoptes scabiei]KPM09389.1 phosphopantothenoylcysteine decarboxylase-like protein [Sarcoptes scabiei]UXI19363.1 hypothetical protein NH340_JMT05306 [Sarcoptes scabiei]